MDLSSGNATRIDRGANRVLVLSVWGGPQVDGGRGVDCLTDRSQPLHSDRQTSICADSSLSVAKLQTVSLLRVDRGYRRCRRISLCSVRFAYFSPLWYAPSRAFQRWPRRKALLRRLASHGGFQTPLISRLWKAPLASPLSERLSSSCHRLQNQ